MASDDSSVPIANLQPEGFIPAAYTYFGQFIDHDMTYDTTDVPEPGEVVRPEDTQNRRRNFLNLDCLYGDDPAAPQFASLYEADGIFFRLGAALSNGRSFDVPLRVKPSPARQHAEDGLDKSDLCQPQTADPRNAENVIVRQIHAMFLQLHNMAVEESLSVLPPAKAFAAAQERVRHQYQWLVWNDYLPAVCNQTTLEEGRQGPSFLIDWSGLTFSIPVEFAQAAFRFGHAMVRSSYRLSGGSTDLTEIFGGQESKGALPTKMAVNWDNFCALSVMPEYARPIGTTVVNALYQVPTSSLSVFLMAIRTRAGGPPVLPLRTLQRGAANCLSSGESAIRYLFGHQPTTPVLRKPYNYWPGKSPFDRLDSAHLRDETPLWYYVLMEAELNHVGNRLGLLGTCIVAGTIEGALRSNPESFIHKGPLWRPEPWKARDGCKIRIERFHDVARVVGLA